MAANVRGVEVHKHDKFAWHWYLGQVRWDFRLHPKRGLWFMGNAVPEEHSQSLHCPDDAVLWSMGFMRGLVTGQPAKESDQ